MIFFFFSFSVFAWKEYHGEKEKKNKIEIVLVDFNYKLNRCVTYGNVDLCHDTLVMGFLVTVLVNSENISSNSRKKLF